MRLFAALAAAILISAGHASAQCMSPYENVVPCPNSTVGRTVGPNIGAHATRAGAEMPFAVGRALVVAQAQIPSDNSGTVVARPKPKKPANGSQNTAKPNSSDATRPAQGRAAGDTALHAPPVNPKTLVEHVIEQNVGSERFHQIMGELNEMKTNAANGRGAPMADRWFDGASGPRTGEDQGARPGGTPFFGVGGTRSAAEPAIVGGTRSATVEERQQINSHYGSIPGGVVLEGSASELGRVSRLDYDGRFNAITVNDQAVYFVKIPSSRLAELCRAIALDDRVGVSLGRVQLVYGKLLSDSEVAFDLKLADHFLGDIVFARNDWSRGYSFPEGFKPQANVGNLIHTAVFFDFNGFKFQTARQQISLARANFDVRLVPLSDKETAEGGLQPDLQAGAEDRLSKQFAANARHISDHIAYYRHERIVSRTFAYGEAAAFLRGLKAGGANLGEFARRIGTAVSS